MSWKELAEMAKVIAGERAEARSAEETADVTAAKMVPPHLRARVLTFSMASKARGVPLASRRSVLDFLMVPRVLATPDVAGKFILAASMSAYQARYEDRHPDCTMFRLVDGGAVGVDAILRPDSGPNGPDGFCWALSGAPLFWAARGGRVEGCKQLLERGASVDLASTGQSTALWQAAHNDHLGVVELLLAHGANPHIQAPEDPWSKTCASWKKPVDVVCKSPSLTVATDERTYVQREQVKAEIVHVLRGAMRGSVDGYWRGASEASQEASQEASASQEGDAAAEEPTIAPQPPAQDDGAAEEPANPVLTDDQIVQNLASISIGPSQQDQRGEP